MAALIFPFGFLGGAQSSFLPSDVSPFRPLVPAPENSSFLVGTGEEDLREKESGEGDSQHARTT